MGRRRRRESVKMEMIASDNVTSSERGTHPPESGKIVQMNKKLNPLLHHIVLENVFKHLDFADLKNCRFVNSIWKVEGGTLLKRRSVIRFRYFHQLDESRIVLKEGWSSRVSTFKNDMEKFCGENFSISLQILRQSGLNVKDWFAHRITLTTVLEMIRPEIKFLELNIDNHDEITFDSIKRILSYCYTLPKLNHLRLNLKCAENATDLWRNVQLPTLFSVNKLELNASDDAFSFPRLSDSYCCISTKLLQLLPNLTSLIVTSDRISPLSNIRPGFITHVYNQLEICPQLNNIEITVSSIPPATSLSKIPLNIKRLELVLPQIKDPWEVENMLAKVSPTIQVLRLIIPGAHNYFGQHDRPPVEVALPVFPKLKKFTIQHFNPTENFPFCLRFQFVGGQLDYNKQFPVLEELSLGNKTFSTPGRQAWRLYDDFIPESDQIVKSIRVLYIPHLDSRDVNQVKVFSSEIIVRLSKMFPNIQNISLLSSLR